MVPVAGGIHRAPVDALRNSVEHVRRDAALARASVEIASALRASAIDTSRPTRVAPGWVALQRDRRGSRLATEGRPSSASRPTCGRAGNSAIRSGSDGAPPQVRDWYAHDDASSTGTGRRLRCAVCSGAAADDRRSPPRGAGRPVGWRLVGRWCRAASEFLWRHEQSAVAVRDGLRRAADAMATLLTSCGAPSTRRSGPCWTSTTVGCRNAPSGWPQPRP